MKKWGPWPRRSPSPGRPQHGERREAALSAPCVHLCGPPAAGQERSRPELPRLVGSREPAPGPRRRCRPERLGSEATPLGAHEPAGGSGKGAAAPRPDVRQKDPRVPGRRFLRD